MRFFENNMVFPKKDQAVFYQSLSDALRWAYHRIKSLKIKKENSRCSILGQIKPPDYDLLNISIRKLALIEILIKTLFCQKLRMGSLFNDGAMIHNEN